jgi:hypothetical protein
MLSSSPIGVSAEELALMKEIDRLFTKWPFHGSRKILLELRKAGHVVNRKRVQRLMQLMGLQALVPGPHTSKPHPDHPSPRTSSGESTWCDRLRSGRWTSSTGTRASLSWRHPEVEPVLRRRWRCIAG